MPKVTVTDAQGLVQSAGAGVTIDSDITIAGDATFTGTVLGVTVDNTDLVVGVDAVTAAAGTVAGDAAALPSGKTFYQVTSDADTKGVIINATDAKLGKVMYIINDSAKKCKVYPNTGATIDGAASFTVNNASALMAGYHATNKWFVIKS